MASIKGISISHYNQMETSRGIAYSGKVYVDGKEVGMFENQGNGGCTTLRVPRQTEEEIEKRRLQYYTERPALYNDMDSFIEEWISLYEHEAMFKNIEKEESDKALALVYSQSRIVEPEILDYAELEPKRYKITKELAMMFLEKHGQDKSEVFTSLATLRFIRTVTSVYHYPIWKKKQLSFNTWSMKENTFIKTNLKPTFFIKGLQLSQI